MLSCSPTRFPYPSHKCWSVRARNSFPLFLVFHLTVLLETEQKSAWYLALGREWFNLWHLNKKAKWIFTPLLFCFGELGAAVMCKALWCECGQHQPVASSKVVTAPAGCARHRGKSRQIEVITVKLCIWYYLINIKIFLSDSCRKSNLCIIVSLLLSTGTFGFLSKLVFLVFKTVLGKAASVFTL